MASTKKSTAKKPPAKKAVAAKRRPVKTVKAGTGQDAARLRKLAFVDAYIKNGNNAKQAAITAGYSEHTATQQGSRLLTDVYVQKALAEIGARLASKYQLSVAMVERSIAQELTFDPANLYDKDGNLKSVTDLDEDTRMALSSLEFEQHGSVEAPVFVRKVKWAARQGAREQAMKYLGMFEKDNAQKTPLAGVPPEAMAAAREQLAGLIAAQKTAGKGA